MSHPVWLEGDGFIDEQGRYYPEAQVREAIQRLTVLIDWYEALPVETRRAIEELMHR